MDATTIIDTFNDHLARAKLAALQLLQDIMNSLCEPDPPIPRRFRELRLIAGAILRTQPMKAVPQARTAPTPPPPDSTTAPTSPSQPELSPSLCPASPSPLGPSSLRFRPAAEWARATLRSLVKDGYLPEHCAEFPPDPIVDPPRCLTTRSPPKAIHRVDE